MQHPDIDTDSLPLGQVQAPLITKRIEACPETEDMVDNKHRDNTEVCSIPQLESTLVESKINSEPICKLFALFRRADVDAKSILHRGRLFKRSVNGKTEPISIPPNYIYANRGLALVNLSFLEYTCMIEVVIRNSSTETQELARDALKADRR